MTRSAKLEIDPSDQRPKILLVDDIRSNLIAMKTLLRGVDADLVMAESGNEALSLALDMQFALILLDVQMPEMDGYEVAEYLRDNPFSAETPIVFLTASNVDELSQIRGYMSGAIDYVQKPVNEQILLSKVAIFLELYRNKNRLVFALKEVHRQRQILRATFDAVGDGVIATDIDNHISWMNPSAERLTGWSAKSASGQGLDRVFPLLSTSGEPLNDTLFAPVEEEQQAMLRTRSGGLLPVTRSASLVTDPEGETFGGVVVFQDATQAYSRQLSLIGEAQTDPLTGLLNRAGFNKRLDLLLAERRDDLALLFGDLDRFKPVNDRYGHAAGDAVLQEIARRLSQCVRSEDIVARWAGDEFAILMTCGTQSDAEQMASRLNETVARPIPLAADGPEVRVGISFGVAMASTVEWDRELLLARADHLLYASKSSRVAAGDRRGG
ncbi:diguanylate cyclase domain-containing protein [Paracoccus ravus]|uniref:diguanylate cyclase domain-containing protein n=1 Tax=Paracoccus ravus TaxID=2447760 RepID=UPI00106E9D81|nr:diguanylate cyclase [Paracoccus ravus]